MIVIKWFELFQCFISPQQNIESMFTINKKRKILWNKRSVFNSISPAIIQSKEGKRNGFNVTGYTPVLTSLCNIYSAVYKLLYKFLTLSTEIKYIDVGSIMECKKNKLHCSAFSRSKRVHGHKKDILSKQLFMFGNILF